MKILIIICFLFSLSSAHALESLPHHTFSSQAYQDSSTGRGWDEYYQNTLNSTRVDKTLLLAKQYFEIENKTSGLAVDLGTGTGRDALFLLKNGWDVFAIDAEPLAIEILLNRVDDEERNHLEVMVTPFSDMVLPDDIDLINAGYSLPFCEAKDFSACWQNIVDHLAVGGRFAGQFFGDRDEWVSHSSGTFHTQEQMLQLFEEHFAIEYLQIEEGLLPTAAGTIKHWHLYHVVGKKIK